MNAPSLLAVAEQLTAAGLSVIPIGAVADKKPDGQLLPLGADGKSTWKPYQSAIATHDELGKWFGPAVGIGIVGGAVSGGLSMLDFDMRDGASLFDTFAARVEELAPGLMARLPVVRSQRGGRHLYFRCTECGSFTVFARSNAGEELIAIKAQGGYCVAPRTAGYKTVHGSLTSVPTITPEERALLFAVARSYDEKPPQPALTTENLPGAAYSAKATLEDMERLLTTHGWQTIHTRHDGTRELRRPGKNAGPLSATLGQGGHKALYVFTSNAPPFEPNQGYAPFAVYAILEHDGDYSAAASQLARDGYGGRASVAPAKQPPKPHLSVVPDTPAGDAAAQHEFNFTDLGNARRLVARSGQDMRYVHEWGWLVWNGTYWERDTTGMLPRLARAMIDGLYVEAGALRRAGDEDGARKLAQWAFKSESASRLDAMLHLAQAEETCVARTAQFDTDQWLLPCANGVLHLRTGTLEPAAREQYATKASPVTFAADARAPTWDSFLARVLPDDDVRAFVQRYAGYTLTGSAREECLAFLHGSGGNGKSTLLTMLRNVLGTFAVSTAPQTLMVKKGDDSATNDIAMLAGARMVATIEIEDGKRLAESLVKSMTGRDPLTCRFLHKEFFTFVPTFKVWFAANHKPVIRGGDEAIWRRIRLVPFGERITDAERDADPTFADRVALELPGILNWCLAGCLAWQEHGLQTPKAVTDATQTYRDEMDILGPFFDECCLTNQKMKIHTKASDLYRAYTEWCQRSGEEALKQRMFSTRVAERGIVRERGKGNEYEWAGLGLKIATPIDGDSNNFSPEEVTRVTNSPYIAYARAHKDKTGISSNPSNLVTPEPESVADDGFGEPADDAGDRAF